MIYMQGKNGQHIIILEAANLDHLRVGGTVKTPDAAHSVILAFSPDIVWTSAQLKQLVEGDGIDVDGLERLLIESQHRPEVRERPYHHIEHFSQKREG